MFTREKIFLILYGQASHFSERLRSVIKDVTEFLEIESESFSSIPLNSDDVFFSKDIGRSDAYILIRQQNSSAKWTTMVQPRELVDRTLNLDQSVYPLIE